MCGGAKQEPSPQSHLKKTTRLFKTNTGSGSTPRWPKLCEEPTCSTGRLHSLQAQTCHSAASPTHPRLQVKTHTVDSWNIQHTFEIAILSHVRDSVCRLRCGRPAFPLFIPCAYLYASGRLCSNHLPAPFHHPSEFRLKHVSQVSKRAHLNPTPTLWYHKHGQPPPLTHPNSCPT